MESQLSHTRNSAAHAQCSHRSEEDGSGDPGHFQLQYKIYVPGVGQDIDLQLMLEYGSVK